MYSQLITPYGNITTDPRIIHMVGEKMIFTCTTGKDKNKLKDKFPRKYGTVINLNELEKDERLANSMVSPSTTTIGPVGEYLFLPLFFIHCVASNNFVYLFNLPDCGSCSFFLLFLRLSFCFHASLECILCCCEQNFCHTHSVSPSHLTLIIPNESSDVI